MYGYRDFDPPWPSKRIRIQSTDTRERLWEQLWEVTDHHHTSQALDPAARYYVRIHGDSPAQPTSVIDKLLNAARATDSDFDEQEIADTRHMEAVCRYQDDTVTANDTSRLELREECSILNIRDRIRVFFDPLTGCLGV